MEEHDHKPGIKDLFNMVKKSPALLVTGIVGAVLVVYLLVKHGPSSAGSTVDNSTLPATNNQGSYYGPTDPNTQPQIYLIPLGGSSGSSPGGDSGGSSGGSSGGWKGNKGGSKSGSQGTAPGQHPTPAAPAPVPVTPVPVQQQPTAPAGNSAGTVPANTTPAQSYTYGVVRSKNSSSIFAGYDKTNPAGVPIRSASAAGNDQTGTTGYGSVVKIAGAPVQGGSNAPGNANGSTTWYPLVGGGYISAEDISSTYTGN